MEENYILLKFISSADKSNKKKYLKDFLNGSLYMNTLNYFWNEYYLELAKKRRYAEANGIPFPDKIDMSEHILSEAQIQGADDYVLPKSWEYWCLTLLNYYIENVIRRYWN